MYFVHKITASNSAENTRVLPYLSLVVMSFRTSVWLILEWENHLSVLNSSCYHYTQRTSKNWSKTNMPQKSYIATFVVALWNLLSCWGLLQPSVAQ